MGSAPANSLQGMGLGHSIEDGASSQVIGAHGVTGLGNLLVGAKLGARRGLSHNYHYVKLMLYLAVEQGFDPRPLRSYIRRGLFDTAAIAVNALPHS